MIVHLVFSDNVFGGFEHYVDSKEMVSLQDFIDSIVQKLRETLTYHKMEDAKILLQTKKFHIHGYTMEDILNNPGKTIYVCHHE